jgi:hypothetical protein
MLGSQIVLGGSQMKDSDCVLGKREPMIEKGNNRQENRRTLFL